MARLLTGQNYEATDVVDVEAAQLHFGCMMTNHRQRAAVCRNAKDSQNARSALAGI